MASRDGGRGVFWVTSPQGGVFQGASPENGQNSWQQQDEQIVNRRGSSSFSRHGFASSLDNGIGHRNSNDRIGSGSSGSEGVFDISNLADLRPTSLLGMSASELPGPLESSRCTGPDPFPGSQSRGGGLAAGGPEAGVGGVDSRGRLSREAMKESPGGLMFEGPQQEQGRNERQHMMTPSLSDRRARQYFGKAHGVHAIAADEVAAFQSFEECSQRLYESPQAGGTPWIADFTTSSGWHETAFEEGSQYYSRAASQNNLQHWDLQQRSTALVRTGAGGEAGGGKVGAGGGGGGGEGGEGGGQGRGRGRGRGRPGGQQEGNPGSWQTEAGATTASTHHWWTTGGDRHCEVDGVMPSATFMDGTFSSESLGMQEAAQEENRRLSISHEQPTSCPAAVATTLKSPEPCCSPEALQATEECPIELSPLHPGDAKRQAKVCASRGWGALWRNEGNDSSSSSECARSDGARVPAAALRAGTSNVHPANAASVSSSHFLAFSAADGCSFSGAAVATRNGDGVGVSGVSNDVLLGGNDGSVGPSGSLDGRVDALPLRSWVRWSTYAGPVHPLMSVGSQLHDLDRCTPCKFFRSRRGCRDGQLCTLCHYPHREKTYSEIRRIVRDSGPSNRRVLREHGFLGLTLPDLLSLLPPGPEVSIEVVPPTTRDQAAYQPQSLAQVTQG